MKLNKIITKQVLKVLHRLGMKSKLNLNAVELEKKKKRNYIIQNIKLNSMRPFNNGIIQTMGNHPVYLILVAKFQLMVVDKMLKS